MEKETKAMMGEKVREGKEGIDAPLLMRDKFLFCHEKERQRERTSLSLSYFLFF